MNAVDTNILIYSVDQHEPAKRDVAQRLLQSLRNSDEETILPWQVLCETACQLRKWAEKQRMSREDAERYIEVFRELFPIEAPSLQVFNEATDLYRRFRLSHWDSLLVAACGLAGVTNLYSEDMDAGAEFGEVRIVNPFLDLDLSRRRRSRP